MTDEIITTTETLDETQKYLDTITDLKRNSVSRVEYDKIRDENKKLLETLVNGGTLEASTEATPKADIKELRHKFLNTEMSNLDFWKTTLDLRDAIIESGDKDPFLPFGQKIAPTPEDRQKAENVAAVVRECIDYSAGDPEIFTNELQRRTIDVMPARRR